MDAMCSCISLIAMIVLQAVSFDSLPEILQFFLHLLLLLDFLVPVDLASQLISQDNLPLHFQSVYFLFHLMIFSFQCIILLCKGIDTLHLLF